MNLSALDFPLAVADALGHLQDALGTGYAGPTDEQTLGRALSVDAAKDGAETHYRPWATAARLIRFNTEYEVAGSLAARIDRKLKELEDTQKAADVKAGILALLGIEQHEQPLREGDSYSLTTDRSF